MPKLDNAKYEAFSQEYIVDHNGTQAAIRAGYSARSANVKAAQLLTIVSIKERIAELQQEIIDRNKITIDEIVSYCANVMRADPIDFIEAGPWGITIKPIEEIPKEKRILMNDFSFKKGSNVLFKLQDKMAAVEKLMKHLGGYKEDNDQKGKIRFVIEDVDEDGG